MNLNDIAINKESIYERSHKISGNNTQWLV